MASAMVDDDVAVAVVADATIDVGRCSTTLLVALHSSHRCCSNESLGFYAAQHLVQR